MDAFLYEERQRFAAWVYFILAGVLIATAGYFPLIPPIFAQENPGEVGALNTVIDKIDIDHATLRDVVQVLGEPEAYRWGDKTFSPDDLPTRFCATYPGGLMFFFRHGAIQEVRLHSPELDYVYPGGIRIGATLEEVLAVLGEPDRVVDGEKLGFSDGVLYRNIDGKAGKGYYGRTDRRIRLWFVGDKVIALYLTRSDFNPGSPYWVSQFLPLLLALPVLIAVLLTANLLFMRTRVSREEVQVRFGWLFPMYWKHIPVADIRSYRAIAYRPLRDAGGWGIRFGRFEGAPCRFLSARGDRGVLVETSSLRFVIGSQRPNDLKAALAASA